MRFFAFPSFRRSSSTVVFIAALALAGTVRPAGDEIDPDLMQTIEDTNRSLSSNIALKAGAKASEDAKSLYEMFAEVEAVYQRKADAPDAVDLARKSRTLAQQIQERLTAQDFGAATNAATDLARTCKACHTFYKKS